MTHYLADNLRSLANEFAADRDYETPERREEFRKRLIDIMCWSADALDRSLSKRAAELARMVDELECLGLDLRTKNVLRNEQLVTIVQIARETDASLMRTPNFGRRSLQRLRAKVPYVPEGKPRVRVQAVVGNA